MQKRQNSMDLFVLEKLHAKLDSSTKRMYRSITLVTIISFITLSLSLGYVSIDKKYIFSGVDFYVSVWLIILTACWLINIFFFFFIATFRSVYKLKVRLLEVYDKSGYKDITGSDIYDEILLGLHLDRKVFNEDKITAFTFYSIFFFIAFVLIIFPVLTQIISIIKFIELSHISLISLTIGVVTLMPMILSLIFFFRTVTNKY